MLFHRQTDRQIDGRTEREDLFFRTLGILKHQENMKVAYAREVKRKKIQERTSEGMSGNNYGRNNRNLKASHYKYAWFNRGRRQSSIKPQILPQIWRLHKNVNHPAPVHT
mgnify:CR=1 FL=1